MEVVPSADPARGAKTARPQLPADVASSWLPAARTPASDTDPLHSHPALFTAWKKNSRESILNKVLLPMVLISSSPSYTHMHTPAHTSLVHSGGSWKTLRSNLNSPIYVGCTDITSTIVLKTQHSYLWGFWVPLALPTPTLEPQIRGQNSLHQFIHTC